MPLGEAQALLVRESTPETLHCEEFDPAADKSSLRKLATTCEQFTPLFGIEEADQPECLLLDVTGCTHLWDGESGTVTAITASFQQRGFQVRVALAPNVGAAWAAARYLAKPDAPVVVVPPQLSEILQRLPVAALRLPLDVVEPLKELGIRSIGQLRALPRASLPSRFGPLVLKRLGQAWSEDAELITFEKPREPLVATWAGEYPLNDLETLLHAARGLLGEVLVKLQPRREGVRQLVCRLRDAVGRTQELVLGFVAPTDVEPHLFEMLRLQWERATLREDIVVICLEATVVESITRRQRDLFGNEQHPDTQRDISVLLDRLSSRLGAQAVVRACLIDEPQPELAVTYAPYTATTATKPVGKAVRPPSCSGAHHQFARPLCVFTEPQPIVVSRAGPEGAPHSFLWARREHCVIRGWGPERIETGWWREAPIRRDYFRVEVLTGHHYWLFHRLDELDWFIHGAFD